MTSKAMIADFVSMYAAYTTEELQDKHITITQEMMVLEEKRDSQNGRIDLIAHVRMEVNEVRLGVIQGILMARREWEV